MGIREDPVLVDYDPTAPDFDGVLLDPGPHWVRKAHLAEHLHNGIIRARRAGVTAICKHARRTQSRQPFREVSHRCGSLSSNGQATSRCCCSTNLRTQDASDPYTRLIHLSRQPGCAAPSMAAHSGCRETTWSVVVQASRPMSLSIYVHQFSLALRESAPSRYHLPWIASELLAVGQAALCRRPEQFLESRLNFFGSPHRSQPS